MFSLRDLRSVLCPRDLAVLRAQRIMGFLILSTHKSTRSEKPITWFTDTIPAKRVETSLCFLYQVNLTQIPCTITQERQLTQLSPRPKT